MDQLARVRPDAGGVFAPDPLVLSLDRGRPTAGLHAGRVRPEMDVGRERRAPILERSVINPGLNASPFQMMVRDIRPGLPPPAEDVSAVFPNLVLDLAVLPTGRPLASNTGVTVRPNPVSDSGRAVSITWTCGLPGFSWITQSATTPRLVKAART